MPIQISLLCVLPIHVEMHTRVGLPVRNNYLHDEARACEVFDKNFARLGDLQLPFVCLHIIVLIKFSSINILSGKRAIGCNYSNAKKKIRNSHTSNTNAIEIVFLFLGVSMEISLS